MRVIPTEWVRKAFDDLEQEAKEGLLSDKLRLVIPFDLGFELTEERFVVESWTGAIGRPQVRRFVTELEIVDGD